MDGWMSGFNVGIELHIELLPTSRSQPLKMIRRQTITILILHGEIGFPARHVREVEHLTEAQSNEDLTSSHPYSR